MGFERKNKYVVLKRKDIDNHLTIAQRKQLAEICEAVFDGREKENKEPLKCVVVEHDWPMYETTWGEIEKYADKPY